MAGATPGELPDDWAKLLGAEVAVDAQAAVGELYVDRVSVYPPRLQVYAAFDATPAEQVRVVLLGQDPYPNPGQAMGLAFSVPRGVKRPTSLRNIQRAMICDEIAHPDHGDLTGWARQGVLLLNTALTVPHGQAGAHLSRWRGFCDAVISRMAQRNDVVFMLWGAKAHGVVARAAGLVEPDRIVSAPHPAARGAHQVRFQESESFSRVNQALGGRRIDWSALD